MDRSGNVPAFAFVVPNQCHEMHGIDSPKAPADCSSGDAPLIRSGDAEVRALMAECPASPIWATGNTAVVITWDEDGKADRVPGAPQSCCVVDAHNPGGGHIPTIVVTNHGPRGVADRRYTTTTACCARSKTHSASTATYATPATRPCRR